MLITGYRFKIELPKRCHCVPLKQQNRMLCTMRQVRHRVTITWPHVTLNDHDLWSQLGLYHSISRNVPNTTMLLNLSPAYKLRNSGSISIFRGLGGQNAIFAKKANFLSLYFTTYRLLSSNYFHVHGTWTVVHDSTITSSQYNNSNSTV